MRDVNSSRNRYWPAVKPRRPRRGRGNIRSARIEIVLAAAHRQVRAPPVLHAVIFDVAPGLEAADLIGARAERNIERRSFEILLRIIGARKNRQAADKQGNFPPALRAETHGERAGILRFRGHQVAQQLADDGMAFFFQRRQRPGGVAGFDLCAVVESCFRPQPKAIGLAVFGNPYRTRREAVHGVRLVAARAMSEAKVICMPIAASPIST
jgi:hypothetical protein